LDAIGGLEILKGWLTARRSALSQKARAYGLPAPKGMLLLGPPGTGKSLVAKSVAAAWGLPLLRLDLGALRSKYVGESEGNIRKALAVAETVAPCILWCDEIEKSLAGSTGPQGDGGVAADALGTILSWMQERAGAVFVVATANDVRSLPPELLRKGRFDELFYIDLPTIKERIEILATLLRQFGRDPDNFDLGKLASYMEGFTGAEIAALIPDALFEAFADGERELTTKDVGRAADRIVPLSKTASDKLEALRDWAKGRCRMASKPEEEAAQGMGRALEV
jgi:SpoVK/Ycf46/Vps4 family AAA+-type ATPase